MGQDELVLRVSGGGGATATGPAAAAGAARTHSPAESGAGVGTSSAKAKFTHSRESSGASVRFVNCPPANHRRNESKGSGGTATTSASTSETSHVIILSPSGDDLGMTSTSSSTSSSSDEDLMLEDDEEARLMVAADHVDLKDDRLLAPDTNSQNSDYGSFCNTPSSPSTQHAKTTSSSSVAPNSSSPLTPCDTSGDSPPSYDPPPAPACGGGAKARSRGLRTGENGGADRSDGNVPSRPARPEQKDQMPLLDDLSSDDEAGANSSGYTRRKSRRPQPQPAIVHIDDTDSVDTDAAADNADAIPKEPIKTLISFIFLFFAWVATTTSLALTHERVPEIAPLPDALLDNVNYQSWGLDASEIIIMAATLVTFILALFHQHRFIVLRRIFILGGIHYFYRAVTMYITVLPKADPHYQCAPKLNGTTVVEIARRVFKLLSGMGLSINGQHIYCGDYIYSGHTMTLLMTYLIIKEYSPKRWFLLHWLSFVSVVTGILTLLFARGHYSIDVLIAYWITTRLWWIYHTLANNPKLIEKDNKYNYLANMWWFLLFRYFEGNVGRPIPKGFNWPLPRRLAWRPPWPRLGRVRRRSAAQLQGADQQVQDDTEEESNRGGLEAVTSSEPVDQVLSEPLQSSAEQRRTRNE